MEAGATSRICILPAIYPSDFFSAISLDGFVQPAIGPRKGPVGVSSEVINEIRQACHALKGGEIRATS